MATLNNNRIEFKGGELLPQVGSEAYKQAQTGVIPTGSYTAPKLNTTVDTTFDAGNLSKTKPLVVPPPVNDTTASSNLGVTAGIQNAQATSDITTAAKTVADTTSQTKDTGTSSAIDKIKSLIGLQAEKPQFTANLQAEQDITGKTQAVNDINKNITLTTQSYDNQIKELRKNPQGLFGGALESKINDLTRKKNEDIANLSITKSVALGDLNTANSIIEQKVATKFEPIDNQIKSYEQLFNLMQNDLTEKEKIIVQDNLATKKANRESIAKAYEEASKILVQNGGNAIVQAKLDNLSSDPNAKAGDIYNALGKYGTTANTQITQLDNGNTVVVDKTTGKIVSYLGGAKSTGGTVNITGLTPEQASDPFIKKMASTVGGKPITDAFAQKLNKGLTVLDQIGGLQANIKDVSTGPIVGAFRGLNPWDTNAQTIKAQLNAIVPNLARGVYGEVGVLTDNDIAQYSKTLPNLKSPEDVRNAVLGITVDLIGKSIKQTLEVNAANQKDVSGFIDIYTQMQATRNSIFEQIPGYKGATSQSNIQVTPEVQALRSKYNY